MNAWPSGRPIDARQLQLGLLERRSPPRSRAAVGAELHFRAQHVDAGDEAALPEIDRLLVKRLRRCQLRLRRVGARLRRQRLQIRDSP